MKDPRLTDTPCPAGPEVLADLVGDDLLRLEPGERLWKLYCFRSTLGQATDLRHRIYTKLKPNGRLGLVTFATHTPASGHVVRSNIARVPDLPVGALDQIIGAILREARAAAHGYEEVDLSSTMTLAEQLARLAGEPRLGSDHREPRGATPCS
jgi:hypothetical protein